MCILMCITEMGAGLSVGLNEKTNKLETMIVIINNIVNNECDPSPTRTPIPIPPLPESSCSTTLSPPANR